MRLQMRGKRVQHRLDARSVSGPSHGCAKPRQEGRPKGIVAEHAVQIAAGHAAVTADRAFGGAVHMAEGRSRSGPSVLPIWIS